ncbi:MAG: hypothetical protein ACE5IO_00250, partial [Thermoplasmata archaeon]
MDGLQNHSPSNNGRAARAFVVAIASLMLISVFFGIIGNVKASDGTLFPPHSDHAVDSDSPPDGLYNELIVNVSVDVTVSGLFYLTGNLRDTSGVFLIESQFAMAGLSIGVQTIQLEFTGYLIQASGFDGPYQVNLRLFDDSFVVLDTGIHATKPYSAASFQSLPAYFAPPHSDYALDNDGDMLDDYLVASVNVKVNVSGSYEIDATLFDSTGVFFITSGVNDTFLPAGMRTADIAFLGYAIRSSGFDGPYKVELQLFDGSSNLLDNGIYFTSPYSSNGFEQPPAAFLPPHSDQGLDLNGNSLFEYLVVTTSVAVFVEGTYNVEGVSAFGSFENQTYLSTGIQTVELRFIGFEISKSGADGPYLIDLVVRDVFLNVLDNNTYNTAAYSKNDFEPKPPCSLSPPHWDFGVDTDGDTKSNYLVITVNVTVDAPGYYEIRGELYDSMSMRLITSDTNSTRLDVGPNTLNLLFDGVTIYLSRINGPYGVYLALFDDMDFFLGFDIYTTRPYFYTDFDMPPAVLSPPHSDYGLDTDIPPDGSFNFLVVNASIRVKEPGWFLLYGILLDGSLNPITQAQIFANLSAGPSSLPLEFNGLNISRSGINGPYVIFMELLYFEQQLPVYVDTDMYFTGPYNYTDFMAPSLATIWGYVYGASDSSPVDLAQITVVNYTYGWISQAESNVSGYYEINAFDGDFSVLLDGRDLQANLSFISVAGSAEVTRYLEESIPNPIDSTLVFPDWDNIGYDARTEIVTDNESTRFMIDLMVGNRDGYVDQNESDIMESFLASSMPPLPSNTTGQFYVDGIYYDLVPDSDALDLDALGPVVSPNPSFMTVVANYTSSSTIPVSNIHWLELNVTYDNDEETNVYNGQLPSGFTLWDYLPVSNVSFSGIGSQNIMIDPSGDWDPFDANDSVWVNLTVGQGAPDVEAPQVLNAQINDQPSPTYGLSTLPSVVYLNASIDDIGRGNVPIGGANYTIDAQNWSSSTPMNPTDGSFDSPSEDVTVMIVPQPVNTTYCVYGWDAMSNSNTTGSCATITIVDDMGPQIQNILITPSTFFLSTAPPTATLTATIDDTLSGSSTVSGANYTTPSSDSWPGTPMIAADGTFDESVENIAANVPLPTSAGVFDYYVHAWD